MIKLKLLAAVDGEKGKTLCGKTKRKGYFRSLKTSNEQ